MFRVLTFLLVISFLSCKAQTDYNSSIAFSSDLKEFDDLSAFRESLEEVEIIALGENTHGLGEVFSAKAELVQFLHQELGFDLVLFESGFGDAAMAWEQIDSLTAQEFTEVFSSNFYYNSKEIESLIHYAKAQEGKLKIQAFDCQPQQNYLIKRMAEIVEPVDSVMARRVPVEIRGFNALYQLENDGDTLGFNEQRNRFAQFLAEYNLFLEENNDQLKQVGVTINEIKAIKKSNEIFLDTYSSIQIGELMGNPVSHNIRDLSLFNTVNWYKKENPGSKIIIWAQNSHIENRSKPNYNVNWMGHRLKKEFGDKYYSLGAVVYSGKSMNYNGTLDFEHDDSGFLAYHLEQYQKEKFVLDLRKYSTKDFTHQLLLGM